MAMEPINIFSHRIDPRGVVSVLRSLAPAVAVTGPDDAWQEAAVTITPPGRKQPVRLIFRHDPDYYDGPDWPRQRLGMQGYFSRFPEGGRKPDILRLIDTFRFALATDWEPDLDPDGDERLEYLFAVTRHLDGVLFTPSSLRDAEGRILISGDGEFDADAVLPQMPPVAPPPGEEDDAAQDAEDFEEPEPPAPERVARRALALAAVTARALLEQDDPSEPWVAKFHHDTLAWIEAVGVGDELEPDEWKVVQRPPGNLDQRAQINTTWRLEGLAVLAWALGRFDLPVYDELVAPQALALIRSLGFPDVETARALVARPLLRPPAELEALRKQMLGLHWRLRDFTVRPQALDFQAFARDCWFGPMDLRPFRLIDGDLALGDHAIGDAPEELFGSALSAAMERHKAINWLTGGGDVYSKTDTST
jgi:hypothetical protein